MTGLRFHFCESFGTLQEWNRDGANHGNADTEEKWDLFHQKRHDL
jgi:hypothetical protein